MCVSSTTKRSGTRLFTHPSFCPAAAQPELCEPEQGIDLVGKKYVKHPLQSNMFFFPARIASPIWPGAQLHKQLQWRGWSRRHRRWNGSSGGMGAPSAPALGHSAAPLPSSTKQGLQRQPDTRGKQGHSQWFAPLISSWKTG